MSTVDPSLARRRREARRPSGARVAVVLLVLLGGGLATGYSWVAFGEMIATEPDEPPLTAIVGIPVGMLLVIVGSIAWLGIVLKRGDVGIMYGNAAALAGGGAGVLAAGAHSDLTMWIAVGLLALAAVCLLLGVLAQLARRRRALSDDEIRRTGTLTEAVVTDKGYTRFHESDRILTTVTFAFTDVQGVRRWVQRPMVVHSADPVEEGRVSRLWYDAAHPELDRRIVVELAANSPMRPVGPVGPADSVDTDAR